MTPPRSDRNPAELRQPLQALPCFQMYIGWRRAQAFYKPLMSAGMNPQRMYLMMALDAHGELGVGDLACALDCDLGTMSGLLSRMEREDLIERRRSTENRLEVKVRMTRHGRTIFNRVASRIEKADEALLESLKPRDLAALQRVVQLFGDLATAQENPT